MSVCLCALNYLIRIKLSCQRSTQMAICVRYTSIASFYFCLSLSLSLSLEDRPLILPWFSTKCHVRTVAKLCLFAVFDCSNQNWLLVQKQHSNRRRERRFWWWWWWWSKRKKKRASELTQLLDVTSNYGRLDKQRWQRKQISTSNNTTPTTMTSTIADNASHMTTQAYYRNRPPDTLILSTPLPLGPIAIRRSVCSDNYSSTPSAQFITLLLSIIN